MNASVRAPVYRWLELAGKRIECALFQPVPDAPDRYVQSSDTGDWSAARLLLLHEGLGCIALWRGFPQALADRLGEPVIAYSRYGYGQSEVLAEHRAADFMHQEAGLPLASLQTQLGLRRPILVGHSDGASIALLHASEHGSDTQAIVALAPHLFVETVCVESIRRVRKDFQGGDLQTRLARYHLDARKTFDGWSEVWLAEEFRTWNIEAEVARVSCPVLAVQGFGDPFGSMRQIDRIAELLPTAQLLKLENCGHAPHLEQKELTLRRIEQFVRSIGSGSGNGNGRKHLIEP